MQSMTTWPRRDEPRTKLRSHHALPPCVVGTATVLPEHRYDQADLAELAMSMLPADHRRASLVRRFFENVGVGERYLALPADQYAGLGGLEKRSRAFVDVATTLGERAVCSLLHESGLAARDIDMLMTTTVTGIAVPSIDARIMNRM